MSDTAISPPSLLEFPGAHPVKAMGRHTPEFKPRMLEVIHSEVGQESVIEIQEKMSRDQKYVSLTITIHIQSREHLDRIYRQMHATGLLIFAL
jgi:hypothetical protein